MYNLAFYLFLFYAVISLFELHIIERQEKREKINTMKLTRQLQEEKDKQVFLNSIKY